MEQQRQQKSFGWLPEDHTERDNVINALNLPKSIPVPEGTGFKNVTKANLVAVLNRLHSRAGGDEWCWGSVDKIGQEIGRNEKTVRRAIAGLVLLGLLTVQPGRHSNLYRIEWAALVQRTKYGGHPEACHSDPGADSECPTDHSQSDLWESHSDPGGGQSDLWESHSDPGSTNHMDNGHDQCSMARGDSESGSRKGWTLRAGITLDDLREPAAIDLLWRRCVSLKKLPETDAWRRFFFALCRSLMRHYDEQARRPGHDSQRISNPVGLLHRKLSDGEQAVLQQSTEADREWARRAIRELDGVELPRVANLDRPEQVDRPSPEELERQFGPTLDRLSEPELNALAERMPLLARARRTGVGRHHPRFRALVLVTLWMESQRLQEAS